MFFLLVSLTEAEDMGAVIGPNGIPLKVITSQPCRLHKEPTDTSPHSPCEIFRVFYVLPPEKNAKSRGLGNLAQAKQNGFYRIASGNSEAEYRGWIDEKFVEEWHSAQVIQLTPRKSRSLAHFFSSSESACKSLRAGKPKRATHREPMYTDSKITLMPLLETSICNVNENKIQIFRCAFMSGYPGLYGTHKGRMAAYDVSRKTSLDIVFAMDTTSSMDEPIAQVLRSLEIVVRQLADDLELGLYLRFGLVEYRDIVNNMKAMGYVARVRCNLSQGRNHNFFLKKLASLKPIEIGSNGYPEDVLAGLSLALNTKKMKWNPYGWKLIIVVGDSSIKEPNHPDKDNRMNEKNRTIHKIKSLTQKTTRDMPIGFVISAVRVKDPLHSEDHIIGDSQFDKLVTGKNSGWIINARGGEEPEDFSSRLSQKILNGIHNFREVVLLKKKKRVSKKSTAADFPFPVLEYIAKAEGSMTNLHFSSRYATEFDSKGNRLFVPHIFIRKGQLRSYLAFLQYLEESLKNAGEPGNRSLDQIIVQLKAISTMLNLDEPITPSIPLEKFIQAIMEIPIKTPVFYVSLNKLASMNTRKYENWLQNLHNSSERLKSYLKKPVWFKLHPKAAEREEHAFIPLADLP